MFFLTILIKLLVFTYILCDRNVHGDTIHHGGNPGVSNLTANLSSIKTTVLQSGEINVFYSIFQRPVNETHQQTLKVMTGNNTVDSTDRCIIFGDSFNMWGQIPLLYPDETGNGGCDALWGKQCSENILARMKQTRLDDITEGNCGIHIPDLLSKPPPGCPLDKSSSSSIALWEFLRNGTFMQGMIPPTISLTAPWVFYESSPSIDGNYDELMKYFIFTYFIDRSYSDSNIDVAIACFSIYNKTDMPTTTVTMPSPTTNSVERIVFSWKHFFVFLSTSMIVRKYIF